MYLVADIGYSFFFGALSTILLQSGIPLEQLSLINLLGLLYVGRFLVGPLVDRVGFGRLGRYRGWLVTTQLVLVLVWLAMAPLDPVLNMPAVLALATAGLAVSALHDTAMGGLAVRLLPARDRGVGNAIQSGMAGLSIVLGSGGALLLYAHAGWSVTVVVLATLYLVPFGVLVFVAEPDTTTAAAHGMPFSEIASLLRQPRTGAWALLVMPMFMLGGFLGTGVLTPMMLAAHWNLGEIALVSGTLSGVACLAAAFGAGGLVSRLGRRRAAAIVGGAWAVALALLLPLSLGGTAVPIDAVAVLIGYVAYTGCLVCIYTISMDLTRPSSAATDLTLQLAVVGVIRLGATSVGLGLAAAAGFPAVVAAAAVLALVGTAITTRWLRSHPVADTPATRKERS
ncbi:MFS transporter [Pseudonocardia sp. TRM90224]|uniref:MFS transporter n=1 Tax=Pseudonocardia sp. TRM90224 TaxID=2812678 RepID=UPI001E544C85|nr:MFS transporter [Pseudonocardia sp. TRM90224]